MVRVSPILCSLFTRTKHEKKEREKDSSNWPTQDPFLPSNNKDVPTRFYTTLSTHTDFTITFTCHRRLVSSRLGSHPVLTPRKIMTAREPNGGRISRVTRYTIVRV